MVTVKTSVNENPGPATVEVFTNGKLVITVLAMTRLEELDGGHHAIEFQVRDHQKSKAGSKKSGSTKGKGKTQDPDKMTS